METKLMYNLREAAELLGNMSRTVLYLEIRDGAIRPTKIGRRTYITRAELERYVDAKTTVKPAPLQ